MVNTIQDAVIMSFLTLYLTTSIWPCLAARWSGYNPSLLAISTLQPNAQRVCATVRSPSLDAKWTGVLPSYK